MTGINNVWTISWQGHDFLNELSRLGVPPDLVKRISNGYPVEADGPNYRWRKPSSTQLGMYGVPADIAIKMYETPAGQ